MDGRAISRVDIRFSIEITYSRLYKSPHIGARSLELNRSTDRSSYEDEMFFSRLLLLPRKSKAQEAEAQSFVSLP